MKMRSIPASSSLVRCLIVLLFSVAYLGSVQHLAAQNGANPASMASVSTVPQTAAADPANAASYRPKSTTMAQRRAAAARLAARRRVTPAARNAANTAAHANNVVGLPGAGAGTLPTRDQLYFSGQYPNYANSPLPNVNDTLNCKAPNFCGIRKFVDSLAGLNAANNIGQMVTIATPDTVTFPGSDYYEISAVGYSEKMHSDLPPTQLRGYVQTNMGTDASGKNTVAPHPVHYLGPLIIGHSGVPVRIKLINALPTGAAGNLPLPSDKTLLGSGLGLAKGAANYLENRVTIHMHGGNTPWISDGTPHQWTVPAGDANTTYARGDSTQFVPDMFFVSGVVVPQCSATVTTKCSGPDPTTLPAGASNDPGAGMMTFYYTNQQSARLMFYHDHAYGITRLNVYDGVAAGYLLTDQFEADMVAGTNVAGANPGMVKALPADLIPLVIQDKTWIPQNPASTTVYSVSVLEGGSGYTSPTVNFAGGCTTEPTATATAQQIDHINGVITEITLNSAGSGCTSEPAVTISDPDGTGASAFAYVATLSQQDPTWDSTAWGSFGNLWYPHVYMPNQWPDNPDKSGVNPMGRWDYADWADPKFKGRVRNELSCPTVGNPTMMCPGTPSPLDPAPTSDIKGEAHLGVGSTVSFTPEAFMDTPLVNGTVYPTVTVDPKAYRLEILSAGNDRVLNLSLFIACGMGGYTPSTNAMPCPTPPAGSGIGAGTEVGMVPADPNPEFPPEWPIDGRDGGVPDPAAAGPSWIQIGNEGGLLPAPVTIAPAPINYGPVQLFDANTVSNSLDLMPAERAYVIVDFSKYAGKTLLLYNDAPAAYPDADERYDYFTGDPDQSAAGGAPTTLAGFGPNTRTIMQFKVNATAPTPFDTSKLKTVLAATFKASQPVPIVPQAVYSAVYGTPMSDTYASYNADSMTFTPIGGTSPVTLNFGFKSLDEQLEMDYGRQNATLGSALGPLTNPTAISLGYVDPASDYLYDSSKVRGKPVGTLGDGSQIWAVYHVGVDSHPIHFHLYDVQVLNRQAYDGTVRPPAANELGWKDAVRMNPGEITYVAMRPMSQSVPFPVPDSARLFDVTRPAGPDPELTTVGPNNQAVSIQNSVIPMGWEYVWHCHILGHEEMDLMRTQVFQVSPDTPANLITTATTGGPVNVSFTDMSTSETGFTLQRADDAGFTQNVVEFKLPAQAGWNKPVSYADSTAAPDKSYFYQVQSLKPDADYWNTALGNAALPNLVSSWSNAARSASPAFTMSSTAVTVAAGATTGNTSTITLTPSGGFTGSVTLTAAITSGPTVSLYAPVFSFGASSPVTINGVAAVKATLIVVTTSATTSAMAHPEHPGAPWYRTGGAVLACLLLFGIPARRRSWRAMLGMLVLLAQFSGGMVACGGGGTAKTTVPGTTAGNYVITVTGTSGAVKATSTVNLTVQ